MNANAIVLRDIPKNEARLDLFKKEIQGGFRGFRSEFPMIGWHYASVRAEHFHVGFWCHLSPNEALVRVFQAPKQFVEDEPESARSFEQMALGGAMDHALAPYPPRLYAHWFALSSHIGPDHFPPELHRGDAGGGSRFENALHGTHRGDAGSFLAEFQYAFIRWLVSLDEATEDEAACRRWEHLALSAFNAGEERIRDSAGLFCGLAATLMRQYELLSRRWLTADNALIAQAAYMAEDMVDSGVAELEREGREFALYLEKRKQA